MNTSINKIKLDHLGQYYAATSNENNPGTFSVTAYLNEPLSSSILQQSVQDLMERLPFFNVQLHRGLFWWYHKKLKHVPKIIHASKITEPLRYFEKRDNHLLRIIYGERHFTIEVLHTLCDGRSLARVVTALLTRYFERKGVNICKHQVINCNTTPKPEEMEDAYSHHADLCSSKGEAKYDSYVPKYSFNPARVIVQNFDLNTIKMNAKSQGTTITEYIMTNILSEFAKQRTKDGCQKKITVNVPIDCRSFFKSESMRNFVTSKVITMPEKTEFPEIATGIKKQFSTIDSDFIQEKISEMERLIKLSTFIPLFIKNSLLKKIGRDASSGLTTGFSNLGLIKLPKEIQNRISNLAFSLGPEPNMPYQFACVATGNTLTLTTTTIAEDIEIIERIGKAIG